MSHQRLFFLFIVAFALASCSSGPRFKEVFRNDKAAAPPEALSAYCVAVGKQAYSATYENTYNKIKSGQKQSDYASVNAMVDSVIGIQASSAAGEARRNAISNCMKANGFSLRRVCVDRCELLESEQPDVSPRQALMSHGEALNLVRAELGWGLTQLEKMGTSACYDGLQVTDKSGAFLSLSAEAVASGIRVGDQAYDAESKKVWGLSGLKYKVGDTLLLTVKSDARGTRNIFMKCSNSIFQYISGLNAVLAALKSSDSKACELAVKNQQEISGETDALRAAKQNC
jgi:hypothetical protein